MKRLVVFVLCAAFLCIAASAAFAQDQQPQPDVDMSGVSLPLNLPPVGEDGNSVSLGPVVTAKNASASGAGIPVWSYQITSPVDNKTYTGIMVGKSPMVRGTRSTSIPTVIVPVRVYIAATNRTFDPTVGDPGCIGAGRTALSLTQQSPIFQNANFTIGGVNMGNTQYIDAVQRASFWQYVGAANQYHTLLGPVTVMPLQTITAPTTTQGNSFSFGGQCGTNPGTAGAAPGSNPNLPGRLGVFDINWWDPQAEAMIQSLNIPATSFPLFLFYNVVMSSGPPAANLSNCCILGYHSENSDTSPNLITTYGNSSFEGRNGTLFTGVADVSIMTHEISEWMDDPLGNNPTPKWGHIGQVGGCQGNLETGDPLTGTNNPPVTMPNGYTYHLQELAFYSWFFRQSPSAGVSNWYSSNNTFHTGAGPICQ
ncbi:MAG: hypothetical protein JWO13_2352 [Acidobacteriales bacterium]|nr:hypothetical protein [Terriglobales bacterium]